MSVRILFILVQALEPAMASMVQIGANQTLSSNITLKMACYGAATALSAVTVRANLNFGLSLGNTAEEKIVYAIASVAADVVKNHGCHRGDPALAEASAYVGLRWHSIRHHVLVMVIGIGHGVRAFVSRTHRRHARGGEQYRP